MFAYCNNRPGNGSDPTGAAEFIWDVTYDGSGDIGDNISTLYGYSTDCSVSGGGSIDLYSDVGTSSYSYTSPQSACYGSTFSSYSDSNWYSYSTCSPEYAATTGTPYEIGLAGENLAGIDQLAKRTIEINGRTRIPDGLNSTTLTEVKNVAYISNTQQLRDFADFAHDRSLTMNLFVRPTTKIAKTVIQAGWSIFYLWEK